MNFNADTASVLGLAVPKVDKFFDSWTSIF